MDFKNYAQTLLLHAAWTRFSALHITFPRLSRLAQLVKWIQYIKHTSLLILLDPLHTPIVSKREKEKIEEKVKSIINQVWYTSSYYVPPLSPTKYVYYLGMMTTIKRRIGIDCTNLQIPQFRVPNASSALLLSLCSIGSPQYSLSFSFGCQFSAGMICTETIEGEVAITIIITTIAVPCHY